MASCSAISSWIYHAPQDHRELLVVEGQQLLLPAHGLAQALAQLPGGLHVLGDEAQYPRTPMASDAEHFHFLEILAGTYDSSIKNMRIADNLWNNTQFIAAFPVERVPKHPLSGISTRSGDLARFTFKNMVADRVQRMYIHLLSYQIVTVSGSGVSVLD